MYSAGPEQLIKFNPSFTAGASACRRAVAIYST